MPESPPILLRPATPADAPAIANLYLTSRKAFLPYAPLAHSDAAITAWITEKLLATRIVTVAENPTGLLGFIALSLTAECTWIDHLYLHPNATGQTIGTRLLTNALKTAPRPVRIYTFQANTRARRFYERHCFRPIAFTGGENNEEHTPDVLYELTALT